MVFWIREPLIRQRTQANNALRGHLAELRQIVPQDSAERPFIGKGRLAHPCQEGLIVHGNPSSFSRRRKGQNDTRNHTDTSDFTKQPIISLSRPPIKNILGETGINIQYNLIIFPPNNQFASNSSDCLIFLYCHHTPDVLFRTQTETTATATGIHSSCPESSSPCHLKTASKDEIWT